MRFMRVGSLGLVTLSLSLLVSCRTKPSIPTPTPNAPKVRSQPTVVATATAPIKVQSCIRLNIETEVAPDADGYVPLQPGSHYAGELPADDSDTFAFNALEGQPLLVQITPKYDLQASIVITAPNGQALQWLYVWYVPFPTPPNTEVIIPQSNGRYYLQLFGANPGSYQLRLDDATSLARIYSGDTCQGYVGKFQSRLYMLPVTDDGLVVIDVDPQAGFDPVVTLYDPGWKVIVAKSQHGSGLPEHVVISPEAREHVLLEITGYRGSEGEYTVTHK